MEFLVNELTGKRPLLPPDLPMTAEVRVGYANHAAQPRARMPSLQLWRRLPVRRSVWPGLHMLATSGLASNAGGRRDWNFPHARPATCGLAGRVHHLHEPHGVRCAGGSAVAKGVWR